MEIIAINTPDPAIAKFYVEWKRNRNLIAGARAVKAAALDYLPFVNGQDQKDYEAYVARVPFVPGAARCHEGLMGLIFRKAATLISPDAYLDIMETITADGFTVDDLAEEIQSELLITNFTGLVTDYPITPAGLSKAQAIALGYRPFVALYRAESILGIETAVVNNRQRVVRVRLLENTDTIRELRLDDGVYSITIHRNNAGNWSADAPIIPLKNNKPIDEIPFKLSSTSRKFFPTKAPLSDVCEANVDHYIASANLATMEFMTTVSVFQIMGAKGKPSDFPLYPGAIWIFDKHTVKTEVLQPSGETIDRLRDSKNDHLNTMAVVGSRILTGDKNVAEAAETIRIRSNSDNASLGGLSRIKDRAVNDQLSWMAWWMDLPEDTFRYEGSTDFNTAPMDAAEAKLRMEQWQAGVFSHTALIDQYREGEWIPENFDAKLDKQLMSEEIADQPTTEV